MNRGQLDRVVVVKRFSRTSDGQGGWTDGTPAAVSGSPFRMHLQPAGPRDVRQGDQLRGDFDWTGRAALEADVQPRDVLEVDGMTLSVVGTQRRTGSRGYLRFTAKQHQREP